MAGIVTFGLFLTILCTCVGKLFISGDVVHASLQFSKESNAKLTGSVLGEIKAVSSAVRCSVLCRKAALCRSFNYDRTEKYCQLNRETKSNEPGNVVQDSKYTYYEMENQIIFVDSTKKPVTTKIKTELTSDSPSYAEPINPTSTTHTSWEPTSEEPTPKEPTTLELTTELPTSEEPTTFEPATVQPTSEEPITTETTTLKPTTEQPTSEEPTTTETTTLEPTTLQPTSEEPTTTEPTGQPTSEEPTTTEPIGQPTSEGSATTETTTLEPTTLQPTSEEPTTTEHPTLEPMTEQPTSKEPTITKTTILELTTGQPTSEEPTTAELTTLEPTTKQTTTAGLNLTTEKLTTLEPSTESGVYPPTCSAIKLSGEIRDGSYMIDPDGLGNQPPFQVLCDHMSGYGLTHITHTRSADTIEVNLDPYDIDIVYSVPMEQIISLIDQSTNCHQLLMADCRNAKLWDLEHQLAWWVSRDGVQMMNWGGAKTGVKGCSCFVNNNCVLGNRCNCGAVPDEWVEEGGRLSDISKLPVSELHFENAGPPNQLRYTLGSLQCLTRGL